jgi:16S rRNA (adenine1518-N6/adenine1519-N6)-dimethyltransferase
MPMYQPAELNAFLNEMGIFPKKNMSQNFLIDGNMIRKMVASGGAEVDDLILEVGPGPGALTEVILENGCKVLAVEKDQKLGEALGRFQEKYPGALEIHIDDILDFDLDKHLSKTKPAKVIANLPYHLTTPILARFLPRYDLISQITVMIQDEVARRLLAKPGQKDYNHFALFLQLHAVPRYAFPVSRHCFYPVPNVDSAVVTLHLKPCPEISDPEMFFKVTRRAYEQRRKMLRGSLSPFYTKEITTKALESSSLNPQARPEELSPEDFITFFEAASKLSSD